MHTQKKILKNLTIGIVKNQTLALSQSDFENIFIFMCRFKTVHVG